MGTSFKRFLLKPKYLQYQRDNCNTVFCICYIHLLLKVAVLSDQIESATDKIGDMEKLLDDKKEVSCMF